MLSTIERDIPRVYKDRWLSLAYDLKRGPQERSGRNEIEIRPATEQDIGRIAAGPDGTEPIVQSSLRFWREYGFRSLYLGFLPGDPEPSIFQFAIDHRDNHRYAAMQYGRMYRRQPRDSVQVENIYTFKAKRRRNLALDFELRLFQLFTRDGKKRVRTHISTRNRAALLWARTVGFRPEHWITMVTIDLPLLRNRRKQFAFSKIRQEEYEHLPLSLFRA